MCPIKPICLLLALGLFYKVSATPIIIGRNSVYTFDKDSWSYYVTDSRQTDLQPVIQAYQQSGFREVKQSVFNGGIPRQYLWFHFTIVNQDSAGDALIIDVESPRINELELFESDGDGYRSLGRTGDFFDFSQRSIAHKNFAFQSHLAKGEKRDYFLYVNQVGHTLILPIKIYKSKQFPVSAFSNYLIDGLTYGILLFVVILSLLFFINTGHYLYLFYGLYVLTAIAWFLSYFGVGYQYLWGAHPRVSTLSAPLFASLNLVLNIQICQSLLKLKKAVPLAYRLCNISKSLLVMAGLFPVVVDLNKQGYVLNHTYLLVFLSIVLLSVLVAFISVVTYSIRGAVVARFYLAASVLKTGSIFNLALLELGITPGLYDMEGLLQAGILIEITLLSYAIAKRYTNYKLRSFKNVIAAQEGERRRISTEIHDGIANSLGNIGYNFAAIMRDSEGAGPPSKEEIKEVQDAIEQTQVETRNISHFMMPDYILGRPLSEVIEEYILTLPCRPGRDHSLPTIGFSLPESEPPGQFSDSIKLSIFRIVQELLSNILKHSRATSADISLTYEEKNVLIVFEDNGIGFPVRGTDAVGIGISSIRSRVRLLNGSFSIEPANKEPSADGHMGTLIVLKVPYKEKDLSNASIYDY